MCFTDRIMWIQLMCLRSNVFTFVKQMPGINFDDDVKQQHLHSPLNNEAGEAVVVEEMNAAVFNAPENRVDVGDVAMTVAGGSSHADKRTNQIDPVLEPKLVTGMKLHCSTSQLNFRLNIFVHLCYELAVICFS